MIGATCTHGAIVQTGRQLLLVGATRASTVVCNVIFRTTTCIPVCIGLVIEILSEHGFEQCMHAVAASVKAPIQLLFANKTSTPTFEYMHRRTAIEVQDFNLVLFVGKT